MYVDSTYVQCGHGIGIFLAGLFRAVKPLALRGAKSVVREALNTGAQILADIGST
jgi:hypothetical protein